MKTLPFVGLIVAAIVCVYFTFFWHGDISQAHISGPPPSMIAKIVVKADGTLFFDGKKVELRELDSLLGPVKEKNGAVWYYRANPEAEPHPLAMEALKAVIARQLPIRIFSKEDFSEYIGADGKSHKQAKG